MAVLNKCMFRKNRVDCHQRVLKFKLWLAIPWRTFNRFLDCFIPNLKLKYEDSENIKACLVNTVVFNLHQIKRRAFFATPGRILLTIVYNYSEFHHFNSQISLSNRNNQGPFNNNAKRNKLSHENEHSLILPLTSHFRVSPHFARPHTSGNVFCQK